MTKGRSLGDDRRALIEWTDDELRTGAKTTARYVEYSYQDFMRELDRRAANRQAQASTILTLASIGIAVVAVLVAAFKG